MKKFLLFVVLVFALITGGVGCDMGILSPIGPAINFFLAWKDGEATKYYHFNSDIVYRATKRSLIEMGLPITRDDPVNNGSYYVIAGNNNQFKIKITPYEADIAKLSCRIDFMGDKPYAELLYAKVDEELNVIDFDQQGNPKRWRNGVNP